MKAASGSVLPQQACGGVCVGRGALGSGHLTGLQAPPPSPPRVHLFPAPRARPRPERRSPAERRELGVGGRERPRQSGPAAGGKEGEVQGLWGREREGRRKAWSGVESGERKEIGTPGVGVAVGGGGVGGGRRRRCRRRPARAGAADELPQTLPRALAGSSQPPQRLGEGGRAGRGSRRRRRDARGIAEHPREAEAAGAAGSVKTAAAPPAIPERTRPPGLRDQGPLRPRAAPERASRPRRPAPPGPLPPPARLLSLESGT